jgi:hypothetical protein
VNQLPLCPVTGREVLTETLGYGFRETGVVNSHDTLVADWNMWDYCGHEIEDRLLVDGNSLDEIHRPRCMRKKPKSRSIELNPITFTRVCAHPRMGEICLKVLLPCQRD